MFSFLVCDGCTTRGGVVQGRGASYGSAYLLSDAVEPTHYGRVYGLERTGDMLGAVSGPLAATILVWLGLEFKHFLTHAEYDKASWKRDCER